MTSAEGDTRTDEAVLVLRGVGVAFGDQVVLQGIDLALPRRGVTVVVGHGGAGKSTLVRSLAGTNRAQPSYRMWGEARYLGAPLGERNAPAFVAQSARLLMATVLENLCLGLPDRHLRGAAAQRELVARALDAAGAAHLVAALDTGVLELSLADQRVVAVVRTSLCEPALLMVDEPTAGLDDAGRARVIDVLRREATRRAVLCVTHNREDALELADTTVLLVRGRVAEVTPTRRFFDAPNTEAGRRWVETGSCYMTREELGSATTRPPMPRASYVPSPRGFHWIWPGALAGMARPGLLDELEDNLSQLRALGVDVVLGLEEEPMVPVGMFSFFGMEWFWLPIPDMGAPELAAAEGAARRVLSEVERGRTVAVHCRAGLGRTGTMLAAVLILRGASALEALEGVRRVQPRFVQSDTQIEFLERFDRHVRCRGAAAPSHHQPSP